MQAMEYIGLHEDKISLADIIKYLSLLKGNMDELNLLEFKTIKGWLVYSLSLVLLLCIPCVIILLITGLLSGNIDSGLLLAVSFIPFLFILPLTLLLTFINNYRKPKKLRELMQTVLMRYEWDGPINQTGRLQLECRKDHFLFRTEVLRQMNPKGRNVSLIFISVPFYVPIEKELIHAEDIIAYLKGKSLFVIEPDMACLGMSFKMFQKLDLREDIDQLIYVMKRFSLRPGTLFKAQDITLKVPETLEIQALFVFGQKIDQRFLNWANLMLDAGFVSDNMKIMAEQASLTLPQKELKKRVEVIFLEFNLYFSKETALNNYLIFLILEEQEERRSVLEIIQCLASLYQSSRLPLLQEYDLLYKAKRALDETGEQNFWTADPPLTVDNVDTYILTYLPRRLADLIASREKDQ